MMKKIAALGMAAVLMMGLTTAAMAEEKIQGEKVQFIAARGMQTEVQKVTGTVEEVRDFDLVVKDEDGVTYSVPILPIKESEEFKALDLTKGDSITLEGHEPVMFGEGGLSVTLSEEELGELASEKEGVIVKIRGITEGIDGEEMKMLTEGKSAVISIVEAVDGNIIPEDKLIKWEKQISDGDVNVPAIKAIKLDKGQLLDKIEIDGQNIGFIKSEVKIGQLPDMEGMKLFMPTKIMAKGKTIDIHEMMKTQFGEMGKIVIKNIEADAQTGN